MAQLEKLGIRKYLDRLYPEQGGYEGFRKLISPDNPDESWQVTAIAKEFGVSRPTVRKWRDMLKQEIEK